MGGWALSEIFLINIKIDGEAELVYTVKKEV